MRHFLDVTELSPDELGRVLDLAQAAAPPQVLAGRGAALLFEKPSARTRHATEMAVVQLGGHPVYTRAEELGLDTREPVEDVTRILAGYHGVLAGRVFAHATLERMAAVSSVPVVNLLSDRSHPMQALADALTFRQLLGDCAGRTVAYVGDYNNVARSLAEVAALLGMHVALACPAGYGATEVELDRLRGLGGPGVTQELRPGEAVAGVDVVYTDTWTSMGQEAEAAARRAAFEGFTIDEALMATAAPGALFLHCLPAHRGEEVKAEVIDGPSSHVIQQGHNRMHAARGLLAFLLGEGARGVTTTGATKKAQRQHKLAQYLSRHAVGSQAQLVELLAEDGIVATQATVSRDLEDLGAVKVRVPGGETVYAIPEYEPERIAPHDHLRRVLSEWVVEITKSGNLVVVRTPPGCAHVVGSALDRSGLPGLLGTVAGDDTLLIVASERTGGAKMAATLSDLAGLTG